MRILSIIIFVCQKFGKFNIPQSFRRLQSPLPVTNPACTRCTFTYVCFVCDILLVSNETIAPQCNSINLVAREIITNRKKWHEERGLNCQIKVTSGCFCGQEMLSYVAATKISDKFDFQNLSVFLVSKGVPPPYLPSFSTCFTYIHFFTRLYFLRAFIFLHALCVYF